MVTACVRLAPGSRLVRARLCSTRRAKHEQIVRKRLSSEMSQASAERATVISVYTAARERARKHVSRVSTAGRYSCRSRSADDVDSLEA